MDIVVLKGGQFKRGEKPILKMGGVWLTGVGVEAKKRKMQ